MNIYLRLLYSCGSGLAVGYLGFLSMDFVYSAVGWKIDGDKAILVQQWLLAVVVGGLLFIVASVSAFWALGRKKK